jgi:hypothetical protein
MTPEEPARLMQLSKRDRLTAIKRMVGSGGRAILATVQQLWPAYAVASILILSGFGWGLPDDRYTPGSYQADENAAVWAVSVIRPPGFNPHWFPWGTALFYQVYLVRKVLTLGGLIKLQGLYWIYVFGRLVSYASALGAITFLYLLARKLFDTSTARLAALILSVLPGFVINSHYFKTDVPMTCWLLATLLAAYQVIATGRRAHIVLLGLLVGYTTSVKYSAAVLVPASIAAILMARPRLERGIPWLSYALSVAAGFLVGEPRILRDFREFFQAIQWVGSLNRAGMPYHVARPPAWIDYPVHVMPYALTLPMLLTAAIALFWVAYREGRRLLPIWVLLGCYAPLMFMDNWRLVRYNVPLLPFAALFVAYLARTMRSVPPLRWPALAGVSVLIAYAFLFSLSYVQVMAQTDPRVQASQWIERNLPKGEAVAVLRQRDLNVPELQLFGYSKQEVGYSATKLREAASNYLVLGEFGTRFFQEAIDHYPQHREFFDYVRDHYAEVAHFENSQQLLGIDSKKGDKLPQDWLHPNPRITIYRRWSATDSGG